MASPSIAPLSQTPRPISGTWVRLQACEPDVTGCPALPGRVAGAVWDGRTAAAARALGQGRLDIPGPNAVSLYCQQGASRGSDSAESESNVRSSMRRIAGGPAAAAGQRQSLTDPDSGPDIH
jgi:hypothetical protein